VAADDLGEGVFGVLPGVAREQLQVGVAHFQEYIAADRQNPTRSFALGKCSADVVWINKGQRPVIALRPA
jgi:hypothetical protein